MTVEARPLADGTRRGMQSPGGARSCAQARSGALSYLSYPQPRRRADLLEEAGLVGLVDEVKGRRVQELEADDVP